MAKHTLITTYNNKQYKIQPESINNYIEALLIDFTNNTQVLKYINSDLQIINNISDLTLHIADLHNIINTKILPYIKNDTLPYSTRTVKLLEHLSSEIIKISNSYSSKDVRDIIHTDIENFISDVSELLILLRNIMIFISSMRFTYIASVDNTMLSEYLPVQYFNIFCESCGNKPRGCFCYRPSNLNNGFINHQIADIIYGSIDVKIEDFEVVAMNNNEIKYRIVLTDGSIQHKYIKHSNILNKFIIK